MRLFFPQRIQRKTYNQLIIKQLRFGTGIAICIIPNGFHQGRSDMSVGQIYNNPPALMPSDKADSEARKVAEEFEAIFTSYMMRAMRKTVNKSELIPESLGENIYTDMLDDEYAKIISENASLGLADLIFDEIQRNEGQESSAMNALRGLDRQPWMTDNRFVPNAGAENTSSRGSGISAFQDIIMDASQRHGVDPDLISAVIAQESSGNPYAVSRAGAKGLMQLIDSTAKDMGVRSVFNPTDNINGGTMYLKNLLKLHNGDERLALASYNAGPAAVEKYNGIPPFPETRNYVENVLKLREVFANRSIKDENK
jgi:Rod binding domain-containing protein